MIDLRWVAPFTVGCALLSTLVLAPAACDPDLNSGSTTGGETSCQSPLSACNDTCVDLQTSPNNCGKCGNVCSIGDSCEKGVCTKRPVPEAGADASDASADAPADTKPTPTLDCAFYCNTIMASCAGAQAQYTTMATCLSFCARFPQGTLGDANGNTLGCRINRALGAGANPTGECANAGPSGGDTTPGGGAGACGDVCESFCGAGTAVCPGQTSECALMLCPTYSASPAPYSTAQISGNHIGCRLHYLTLATENAAAATVNCPNIGIASPTCM